MMYIEHFAKQAEPPNTSLSLHPRQEEKCLISRPRGDSAKVT